MTINLLELFYTYLLNKKNIIIINQTKENKIFNPLEIKYLFKKKIVVLNHQWKTVTIFSELNYYEFFLFITFQIGSFLAAFLLVFIEFKSILPLFFIFVIATRRLFYSVKIIVK
jgi:hypothetical protein